MVEVEVVSLLLAFAVFIGPVVYLCQGVVTVVYVAGYQSVGLAVFDHDVVAVGEGFAATGLAVAGFLNASDFVADVIKNAASLVGALNEVDGFVVGVGEGMPQRVGENKLFKYTIRRQYNT